MSPLREIEDRATRILIVDDEERNRQLLEVMLGFEGFEFESAASGETALVVVQESPPDLILLDVMMPGMSGYEVAAKLKSNPATRNIPIIMVSALDDRASRMLGLGAGAEEFLSKPVDRAELCVRVRNLVRLKAYGDYHDSYSQLLEDEVGSRTAELVESEARFRQLADAISEVFFLVDPAITQVFYVSPAYVEIYGRDCESLYASPSDFVDSIHPDDCEWVLREIMPKGVLVAFDTEFRIVRPDGAERAIRARGFPIYDGGGQVYRFAGIAEDITERKTLEAQFRQASKMDAVGRLASGVAHDFNNLLSVVISYSELIAADLKEGDPVHADLEEIRGAGMRAVSLTRQLLAFSRQQVLQPRMVDLTDIVSGMKNMLSRLIGEDVELTATATPTFGKIMVDPGQIEQVIMNLAVNARDAMPRGGKLTIETAEVILDESYASGHVAVKAGPHMMLAVSDTGIGMDKATQTRMFEPFFTTKEEGKGTGLGLATVFGIVRQSGGTIWVYSELGKGTTFKVYFPTADRVLISKVSTDPSGRESLLGFETILLVEDEERVRVLAHTILRRYGYNVIEAQSGADALVMSEQHEGPIDLLLTDVVMPRMSGSELAERLQKVRPEMKVLYMSGHTDDAVVRHGVFNSTVAFFQKPITPELLARKVRETLGQPDPARAQSDQLRRAGSQ